MYSKSLRQQFRLTSSAVVTVNENLSLRPSESVSMLSSQSSLTTSDASIVGFVAMSSSQTSYGSEIYFIHLSLHTTITLTIKYCIFALARQIKNFKLFSIFGKRGAEKRPYCYPGHQSYPRNRSREICQETLHRIINRVFTSIQVLDVSVF